MIVVEYISPENNLLIRKEPSAAPKHIQILEQLNEPIILNPNLINDNMCVYICSPSAMECKKLEPTEFKIVDNALVLLPTLLRRFTFLPGSQVIVTKQPEELEINASTAEYNFVLLIKSVDEVIEKLKIRPKVAISTFEKYVQCTFVNENGDEISEVEVPVLDDKGIVLTVKIKIKSTLFDKIAAGEYPAIDLEFEYYQ